MAKNTNNNKPFTGARIAKTAAVKEGFLTEGGIETPVQAFGWGNPDPLRVGPFVAYYGDHKEMGSQMLPTAGAKGRGNGGTTGKFRSKLNTGGN